MYTIRIYTWLWYWAHLCSLIPNERNEPLVLIARKDTMMRGKSYRDIFRTRKLCMQINMLNKV